MNNSAFTFLKCFWRSFFIGASFNTRGLQNIGLIYALDPGLKAIYPKKEDLQKARKRYVKLHNCHPFWTPLLVGIFLFLEQKLAQNIIEKSFYNKVRPTVVYTLSALGDSFFGGSLLPFWSLLTVLFLVLHWYKAAFFLGLILFIGLQIFKFYTFFLGLKYGFSALSILKKWDLINLGQYLKIINSGLILVLLVFIWPFNLNFWTTYFVIFLLFISVLIFKKYLWFREIVIFMIYMCLLAFYYFK